MAGRAGDVSGRCAVAALSGLIGTSVAAGAQDHGPFVVRLDEDRLSLSASRMRFMDLLTALSRESGIAFAVTGDPSGIEVSDSFSDLELSRGLQRILSAHSHLLVDRGFVDSMRQIDVILLGPSSTRQAMQVREVARTDSTEASPETPVALLIESAVSMAPAAVRVEAIDAIAYRSDDEDGSVNADQVLVQLLSDRDEAVRARAIETLKDTAERVPFAALAQIVREDASPRLRAQALELLVERSENGESHEPLRVALGDDDSFVQRRARELMVDWQIELEE